MQHCDESYDDIVLVGGLLQVVLVARRLRRVPTELKNFLKTAAAPYLYSGPSPIASLATVLVGSPGQRRARRLDPRRSLEQTAQVLDFLDQLGVSTPNRSGFPIVEVPLARHEDIDAVGRFLFEHGAYVTLAAYPLVPKSEVGFRIQMTAANTQAQVDHLLEVLGKLASAFELRSAEREDFAA